ncbi:FxSxx-COOH system tetratricopeptide repeat protein [Streptomyces sp. NPDC005017]|uniref:FxSxx-COOH system tetratricopeptide repeat protein n=1 Tax=Streptomyces sp. NPDC005017 TaxID=3364706 RepID=UPI003674041E
MTNYATSVVPNWASRPWLVWSVFGALAAAALVLDMVSRRLDVIDSVGVGGSVRLVPLGRARGGMTSLRAPHGFGPLRGRGGELDVLRRLLARPQGKYAVVCGVGGIGKTALASALADVARAEGRGVFWIRWRSTEELAEQMTRTALACGLSEARLEEARSGRAGLPDVVWEQLEQTANWLLVLDNVDAPQAVGPDGEDVASYRGWIRPSSRGLLLVTSRNIDPVVWGTQAVLRRVAPLEPAAGGQVLCDAAAHAGTAQEARELADRLGGLPLALHAVGRYLAAPGSRHRTFTAYATALDTQLGTLLGASQPRASDPAVGRTLVRYTWELSLDQLAADGNSLARPVLQLLSLLAPAPIPVSLLTPELVTETTRQQTGEVEVEAALNGLHTYGLVDTPTRRGGQPVLGQVVLHPLIREITAHTHTSESTEPNRYQRVLTDCLIQAAQGVMSGRIADWDTARLLAPHLLCVAAHTTNQHNRHLADAVDRISRSLKKAGDYGSALQLQQAEHLITTRCFGPDHPETLSSRHRLADALDLFGRHQEAAELHQQILTARERILGADHPETLVSRNNLANALDHLGRHQEAADHHRHILAARERVLGPEQIPTLHSRNNLGLALGYLGCHQEAADLHRRALFGYERVLGADHPHTLNSRNNLALALDHLGLHREAADLHRQVLSAYERVLGPDHPDTLHSRDNLALALDHLGRHREAADLHRQVLSAYERILGPDHPSTLTSRDNLGLALDHLGRHREAADHHQQVLTTRERVLGPAHPHTLHSRDNLAAALRGLGRADTAMGHGRRRWFLGPRRG